MDDEQTQHNESGETRQVGAPLSAFLQSTPTSFGIAHLLGMQIERAQDGVGLVRVQIDQRLMHPQQMVHGGVIFTIADTAMSMALLSVIPSATPFGTIEAKINYIRPASSGDLLAEGKIIHQGRTTAVMEATVYNLIGDQQKVIAKVMGTFYIKQEKREG